MQKVCPVRREASPTTEVLPLSLLYHPATGCSESSTSILTGYINPWGAPSESTLVLLQSMQKVCPERRDAPPTTEVIPLSLLYHPATGCSERLFLG
jgi:hypothetical protein